MNANTISDELVQMLAHIAQLPQPVVCETPAMRRAGIALFDAGLVNVCPPGDRYKVNDEGLRVLAGAAAEWVRPIEGAAA